jgi:creatinase
MDRPRTLVIENGRKASPTFSEAEMSERLRRLRAHMAREDIDAVLFTSVHNINFRFREST